MKRHSAVRHTIVHGTRMSLAWISSMALLTAIGAPGVAADAPSARADDVVLLDDDFRAQEVGMFSAQVGAHTEYHFLPEAAPRAGWNVACFSSKGGRAWEVKQEGDRRVMAQTYENGQRHTHPMVVAGDPLWQDYCLTVRFAPDSDQGQSGVVFRYHNNRCYYFFGFDDNRVVLKRVRDATAFHQPDEEILATQDRARQPGREYLATVTVEGRNIRATLEDTAELNALVPVAAAMKAEDATYPAGRIGLLSDMPARFYQVKVTATPAEKERFDRALADQQRELDALRAANPRPVVWKKISTEGFGVGRNLRFGDLDGDGQIDVLIGQVLHHGPRDQYSELSCLTAMTFDGKILWRIGEPDPEKHHLTNDVGFQIHDLDRDGRNEVVYCMNFEVVVVDGTTGQVKYKAPTPASKPPANRYPRILGDCLFFCDLRGRGHAQDIIIKDRYWHLWALNDRLEPLWEGECRTGHYPFAADVDGDGRDELAMGYALFDDDGKPLWNLEGEIQDHADGVAIVDFEEGPGSAPRVYYAASDAGAVYVDLKGNILKRHWIGHVQNPAIADFRPDLPGLEVVSINFWGNQGILHFYDAKGEIYHDCEPNPFGSMCLPVNWTGKPGEYFVHNPNVRWGGMFDAWGRCVVQFPDDGHPDMCNAVLDLTGDCRDEVVVWDPKQIWVYTQDDNPKAGKLYRPRRNPLYNYSNYQATISLPGWSEQ
ncbi:MAG: hypothetical protein ACOY3P_25135 [Planctomycetota bacterium]